MIMRAIAGQHAKHVNTKFKPEQKVQPTSALLCTLVSKAGTGYQQYRWRSGRGKTWKMQTTVLCKLHPQITAFTCITHLLRITWINIHLSSSVCLSLQVAWETTGSSTEEPREPSALIRFKSTDLKTENDGTWEDMKPRTTGSCTYTHIHESTE